MSRRPLATILAGTLAAVGLTTAAGVPAAATTSCDPGDCFSVNVSLDRAPAVGQTAKLTVEITPKHDIPDATTIIELPETLRWATPPAGLTRAAATIGRSPVDRATRTLRARANRPIRYEGLVAAVTPGPASIRVQARDGRPGPSSDGLAYVTVGAKSSAFGMPRESRARRTERSAATSAATSAAGDTCVQGRVTYARTDGSIGGVPMAEVDAFDTDTNGRLKLGWTETDASGGYRLCFPGTEEDGTGQDVVIEVSPVNLYWSVGFSEKADDIYTDAGTPTPDVAPGTSTTVIDYRSTSGHPMEGAFRLHSAAYDTWKAYTGWLNEPADDCWKPGEQNCQSATLIWAPDKVLSRSYYCAGAGTDCRGRFQINLDASEHLEKMTVPHELGHFIMDYTYGAMPSDGTACGKHYMTTPMNSTLCAWKEGWADWVAVQTYGETHYRWATSALDLEGPRWYSDGWPTGPDAGKTEGRVAGVLLDLADSGPRDEPYWDLGILGPEAIVDAFGKVAARDLDHFLSTLGAQHSDLTQGAMFQNAINTDHVENLTDRHPVRRPANVPLRTAFVTTPGRWHVVAAVTVPDGADVDLATAPNAGGDAVRSADWTATSTDFVAVQPSPATRNWFVNAVTSGTDYQEYAMEVTEAAAGNLEAGTPQEFPIAAGRLTEVRTTWIEQGVPATITVVPRDGQDLDLFVMAPDPAAWGLPRSAARKSASGGPNKLERVTIGDPKVTGLYAVVVVRKAGDGNVLLTRI
ncbi:hypothetical protein FXF51_39740 [Nonomuraea sp. PA05]|uniref:hypothetical protein n=1 Tax=Nonomuraea sp. PA05 TaxID=2604466 RepID=UPI0011DB86F2|nr:hypothetical protein [Nonomuraea sp. PA05]TYB57632.1 hypothetical protein FXF51_39740 [Nonomuraea sp. PA05]